MTLKVILEGTTGSTKILAFAEPGLELDIHPPSNFSETAKLCVSYNGVQTNSYEICETIGVVDSQGNVLFQKTFEKVDEKVE